MNRVWNAVVVMILILVFMAGAGCSPRQSESFGDKKALGLIDPRVLRLETKISASDAGSSDHFGGSVSISGDTVVVGASNESVCMFNKPSGGWVDMTESTRLTALDGVAMAGFGSVSVSGDTVVVGAREDKDKGYETGAAYVFRSP
jgi:hypothetical protein